LAEGEQLLTVKDLVAGYGKKQVLNGVSLNVASGEVVALIGYNGAGKSTLLKTVFGLLPFWQGEVRLEGRILNRAEPRDLLHAGVAYVPQGNRVFADLTVHENLDVAGISVSNKARLQEGIECALALFPALVHRLKQRAGTLSGGEKQMLAMANALVASPRLLLMDEPSLGLAPPLASEALHHLQARNRNQGMTILIVEQKVREVLKIAHRVYILRNGEISFNGPAAALDDAKLRQFYL
jgi:branched-chain amino acid transport system ATP-binding protein